MSSIYTTIPSYYVIVYHKLLHALSEYGVELLKDCNAACCKKNINITKAKTLFDIAVRNFDLTDQDKLDYSYSLIEEVIKILNELYPNWTSHMTFYVDTDNTIKGYFTDDDLVGKPTANNGAIFELSEEDYQKWVDLQNIRVTVQRAAKNPYDDIILELEEGHPEITEIEIHYTDGEIQTKHYTLDQLDSELFSDKLIIHTTSETVGNLHGSVDYYIIKYKNNLTSNTFNPVNYKAPYIVLANHLYVEVMSEAGALYANTEIKTYYKEYDLSNPIYLDVFFENYELYDAQEFINIQASGELLTIQINSAICNNIKYMTITDDIDSGLFSNEFNPIGFKLTPQDIEDINHVEVIQYCDEPPSTFEIQLFDDYRGYAVEKIICVTENGNIKIFPNDAIYELINNKIIITVTDASLITDVLYYKVIFIDGTESNEFYPINN